LVFHSKQNNFNINNFTKRVNSIHYYNSVIVIEKGIRTKPLNLMSGDYSFPVIVPQNKSKLKSIIDILQYHFKYKFNIILQFFRLPSYKI